MNMREMVETLRYTADNIEKMLTSLALPKEEITHTEARARLEAFAGGTQMIEIEWSVVKYASANKWESRWTVYDGNKHHKSATLTDAMAKCLAANAPEKPGDLDADVAMVEELVSPLPY